MVVTYTKILTLNKNYVNILTENYNIIDDNTIEPVGDIYINGYINSIYDRLNLQMNVPEPYYSEILAVWGDTPTIDITELISE
jgi:hypothetical protein